MTDTFPQGQRLRGKTALVTGASRGIGRSIALAYAAQGADLILSATNEEALARVQAEANGMGVECTYVAADVTDNTALDNLFTTAWAWREGIDILVNNAGIYIGGAFTDYTYDEFDRLMKVNVYAVFQLMQLSLRAMQQRHAQDGTGGKIVNIASTAGKWESPNQAAYNTTKHAVVGMTRCAALENARHGININAICPGMVETDMFQQFQTQADMLGISLADLKNTALQRIPMGRFLDPAEVAHIAVYLGSDESIGMTGQTITISGGMRMG